MRYLANISYDGSKFLGFQRLSNGKGVQNEIERVLSILAKRKIFVQGAGRTDAGVHATCQCISFDMDDFIDLNQLKYAMNHLLSPYVFVQSLNVVKSDFHARHSAKEKTYLYKIYLGGKNPFWNDYSYICYQKLDLSKMKKCAKLFLGKHDFRNFVSGQRDDFCSEIYSVKVTKENDFIYVTITGKAFYRYMVRSLVGAMVSVGCGKNSLEDVKNSLDLKSSKRFLVLPSNGLYLVDIKYQ